MKFMTCVFLMLPSCTYSITMVHTEGQATDVVDETSIPTSSVTATIPAM